MEGVINNFDELYKCDDVGLAKVTTNTLKHPMKVEVNKLGRTRSAKAHMATTIVSSKIRVATLLLCNTE